MLSAAMKPDLPGVRLRFDRFELDEAEARLTCAGEAASGATQILPANELGIGPRRQPIVTFVHGGADPFLDRPFEDWLRGAPVFVAAHQLLNRLCRAGALAPGEYAITRSQGPIPAGMRDRLSDARAP